MLNQKSNLKMKKLTILLAVVFITATTFGQAQTQTTKTPQKQAAKTGQVKQAVKSDAVKPASTAKPVAATKPAAAATAAPAQGPLKKDGTPDKRYNANKEVAKPAGPLKKDGTPDKRYNANKEAPKAKN
jgi:hypothetical protein